MDIKDTSMEKSQNIYIISYQLKICFLDNKTYTVYHAYL